MENTADVLLDKITDHLKEMTRTETIIGEEFTMGEYKCKPVIKIGVGFGSGSGTGEHFKGKGNGTGTGGGAGVGIFPVGFLVTKGDEITFIPTDRKKGIGTVLDKIPDLIEKAMDIKDSREKKNKEKEEK
jgi:uncharacterized spore protein YtfJ